MHIAVCTTFPNGFPTAEEMLKTFDQHWPTEVDLFIDMDQMSDEDFKTSVEEFTNFLPAGRSLMLNATWSEDKKKFHETHKDEGKDYRFHVCRFSHKVFTLFNVAQNIKETHDYLIWLDADTITNKDIPLDVVLNEFLPSTGEAVSYLGRPGAPHSECGFVGYNLKEGGLEIIEKMYEFYITDAVLTLPGWTDCDVFDAVSKNYLRKNLYSKGGDGWHVWPYTVLGKYTEHKKGARKLAPKDNTVMMDNLQVKTRNCQPNTKILENITGNLKLITKWVDHVKPHNESIVIASAGESLSYQDMKEWSDKGVKIVAVKHAIDRLKKWGIKPWACVLLDPRAHVEKFVQEPDPDVVYFVASMVDPSVTKALLERNCKVIGYHAFVGAGEQEMLAKINPKTMLVAGGSATATRCIGLFHEILGFKDFHCYGYDLCYFDRPDMSVLGEDGKPKYIEVCLGTDGWEKKTFKRVFWTEGQFLAQAQELRDLYKMPKRFNIKMYGPGMATWFQDHFIQQKAWLEKANEDLEKQRENGQSLDEWIRTA